MHRRVSTQLACGLLGAATVTGCTGGPAAPHHGSSHAASHVTAPAPQSITRSDVRLCPATIPSHYPHETMIATSPPAAGSLTFPTTPTTAVIIRHVTPGTFAFGNGKLWTILNLGGVLVASGDMVRPNGSIWWKFPWWRMVAGHLTITGRRLDAPTSPLTSRVPGGYGNSGFQASGVIFPTEGCWQVTAKTAHTSVTFVAFVITKAHRAAIFSNK
jgi:hypothetical protein